MKSFFFSLRDRLLGAGPERIFVTSLLFVGLLRFINLGFLDLQAWDEALYAVRAQGILLYGGFFDQTPFSIGGLYSALHPPLHVWFTTASFYVLGVSEFAARFTSAVFGILTLFVLFQIGKELEHQFVGLVAALLFGLNPYVTFLARQGQFDTTLVFFLALAFMWYLRMEKDHQMNQAAYAGLAVGAALMTKLFVGFGIPLTYFLWRITQPVDQKSPIKFFLLSLAAMAIVFIPWHAYITIVRGFGNPLFLLDASAVLERTLYGVEGNVKSLEWFYFVNQLLVLFPLGILWFAVGCYEIIRDRDRRWLLLVIWFLVFFLVFSLMRTKLSVYVLPMLVPASLIGARTIARLKENHSSELHLALLLGLTALAFLWSASQAWRSQTKALALGVFHAQLPSGAEFLSLSPFLLIGVLIIILTVLLYRNNLIRYIRPVLPFIVIVPSFLISFYNLVGHDRYQYKDGAAELAAFIQEKHPLGIVIVGFDRNPQLTYYLEGADIGWRDDIEVRRITPPSDRRRVRNWLSEEVSNLPGETFVVVEKDKIIRYEWFTAEEVAPVDYILIFDSRRYAVFQRPVTYHLAEFNRRVIPSPTQGSGTE
jgi:4-amino-4-deoxy-L-arabinose transferase-like glycosyltransferase